jgi:outer membrane protein insertion porin family
VRLEGEYLGKEDEFKSLVLLRPASPTGRRGHRDLGRFQTCSACTAMPLPASSRAPRSTAPPARWRWCFTAEPQRRVYVRRIDVAGNTRTRDEVVRREFRQLESAWYDGGLIKLSQGACRPPGLLQGRRGRDQ